MKLVYISSPFTGSGTSSTDVLQNVQNAQRYCKEASEQGVIPVAPHLLFPQWLDDTVSEQRALGMRMALALLTYCCELWVYADKGLSEGMKLELAMAQRLQIPVQYKI